MQEYNGCLFTHFVMSEHAFSSTQQYFVRLVVLRVCPCPCVTSFAMYLWTFLEASPPKYRLQMLTLCNPTGTMPHPSPSTGHRSFRAGAVFGILLVTILLLHFSVVDAGLRHRAENREGHSTEGRKHRQREYHKHDDRNHHRRQVGNDGDTGDTKRTDRDRNHNRKQDTRHQSLQKKHGKEKYFHSGDSTGAADGKPPSVNDGRSKSTDTNSRNEPRSNMDRLAQQLRESRRNKNRSPVINVDHPVDQPEAVATTNTVRRPHAQSKQNQQQNSQAPPTFLSFVLDPVVVTILVLAFTANVLNSSTSTIDSAEYVCFNASLHN